MSEEAAYMSIEEVADKLGVPRPLVCRLVQSGELPAVRLGDLHRVSRADLERYLERSKRETPGGRCAACGTTYRSRHSLRQVCMEPGCAEAICFDCWSRGVRRCAAHAATASGR